MTEVNNAPRGKDQEEKLLVKLSEKYSPKAVALATERMDEWRDTLVFFGQKKNRELFVTMYQVVCAKWEQLSHNVHQDLSRELSLLNRGQKRLQMLEKQRTICVSYPGFGTPKRKRLAKKPTPSLSMVDVDARVARLQRRTRKRSRRVQHLKALYEDVNDRGSRFASNAVLALREKIAETLMNMRSLLWTDGALQEILKDRGYGQDVLSVHTSDFSEFTGQIMAMTDVAVGSKATDIEYQDLVLLATLRTHVEVMLDVYERLIMLSIGSLGALMAQLEDHKDDGGGCDSKPTPCKGKLKKR